MEFNVPEVPPKESVVLDCLKTRFELDPDPEPESEA